MKGLDVRFTKFVVLPLILLALIFPDYFLAALVPFFSELNRADLIFSIALLWLAGCTLKTMLHWKRYSVEQRQFLRDRLDGVFSGYVLAAVIVVVVVAPPGLLAAFNRFDLALALLVLWYGYSITQAVRGWKKYTMTEKGAFFKRSIVVVFVLGLTVGLSYLDHWMQKKLTADKLAADRLAILANNAKGYELHTLDACPYTGFHPRAHCHVKGVMPLEECDAYADFDVKSGAHGFFVDFDVDNPPAKEVNEFRIVLIGGSAAQGYGAQTNEHMFYRLLEKELNQHFAAMPRVRVINLAMAASISYQNYIALNKWGHVLEPDLILSFSGVNDIAVPTRTLSDLPFRYDGVLGLTRATWVTESPQILKDLAKYYPSVHTSLVGVAVRTLNFQGMGRRAAAEYAEANPLTSFVKLYVHAFKSIKRDFQGIPMMIAFQPFHRLPDDFYGQLEEPTKEQLKGYVNNQWYFLNVHKEFQQLGASAACFGPPPHTVHLTNEGQQLATAVLKKALIPIITQLTAQKLKVGAK